ncbi:hypothetical protein RFI_10876 [Reticulomyxa filosa]|uniref:Transmembrane protein n=1 Tax=Reticulomyxa filosa TaxID=46433 RepID=X6NJV6_RETFI|nr:hypothetical protein RFI_10876 [Reticulomyxa filosa]|eukprot:ETO26261.1 hypothetical protein RFI_10876 [Reticulomyxa filosa]
MKEGQHYRKKKKKKKKKWNYPFLGTFLVDDLHQRETKKTENGLILMISELNFVLKVLHQSKSLYELSSRINETKMFLLNVQKTTISIATAFIFVHMVLYVQYLTNSESQKHNILLFDVIFTFFYLQYQKNNLFLLIKQQRQFFSICLNKNIVANRKRLTFKNLPFIKIFILCPNNSFIVLDNYKSFLFIFSMIRIATLCSFKEYISL